MHEEIFFYGLDNFVRIKGVRTSDCKMMSIGLFVGKQQVSKLIYKSVTNEDLKGYVVVKELEIMVNSGEKCKDNFDCELCNLSFESTAHLKEHVDLHCGTCSHTFKNIQKQKRHQKMFGHSS